MCEARYAAVSAAPTDQDNEVRTLTLGELLYADPTIAQVSEKEWLAVVHAIAGGNEAALRLLYEKAFPIVFAYLIRLTGDRQVTDALILDVFEILWCEAPLFDLKDGPVLGWIMREARGLALKRIGAGTLSPDAGSHVARELPTEPATGDAGQLQRALEALTSDERQAIEATLLHGLSYAGFATKSGLPIGTIKSRIRSGLAKLQDALQGRGEDK